MTGTHRSQNVTILLLGSEPVVRSVIHEILESAGYLVRSADNLGKAVDMLLECPADLLIVHPYVAEIPGHAAAEYLRTMKPGMAVLMVAGLPEDDRLRRWSGPDRIELFPPPFTPAQLVEKVRQVLSTIQK